MKPVNSRVLTIIAIVLVIGGILFLALAGYLRPAMGVATEPFIAVQRWITTRIIALNDFINFPRDVTNLSQQNAELQQQVSQLESQIVELQQQLSQAEVLYALLDFARARPENQYIASAVIGRDPSPFLHYIIIDHGSDDGLQHGMPVVTEQGLVGIVDAVTARAARVQLINDPDSVVNVYLQSSQVLAQISGSVTSEINLLMVPQNAKVPINELVLTSGLGGGFPANIVIGKVTSIHKLETDLFQTAIVQPVVDLTNISAVLVITNFKPVDITPLIPSTTP
jgi:rod shape-determining protein MreC